MAPRKIKKVKKKEELPSFLLTVTDVLDSTYPPKSAENVLNLGPIFFGCYDYEPIYHNLKLGPDKDLHKSATSTENILHDAFLPKPEQSQKPYEVEKYKLCLIKPPKVPPDLSPHSGAGFRRIFKSEPGPSLRCLGKTKSVIVGEASEEIPVLCGRKGYIKRSLRKKCKYVMLSDIWEKNRKYASHTERIAHAHFPKHFVMKEVIGPIIPASITITQLPTKRKTGSEICLELNSKTKKSKANASKSGKYDEDEDKNEEAPMIPTEEELSQMVVKLDFSSEKVKEDEADKGSATNIESHHSVAQPDEEIDKKEDEEAAAYTKIEENEGPEETAAAYTKIEENEGPEEAVIVNEETEE